MPCFNFASVEAYESRACTQNSPQTRSARHARGSISPLLDWPCGPQIESWISAQHLLTGVHQFEPTNVACPLVSLSLLRHASFSHGGSSACQACCCQVPPNLPPGSVRPAHPAALLLWLPRRDPAAHQEARKGNRPATIPGLPLRPSPWRMSLPPCLATQHADAWHMHRALLPQGGSGSPFPQQSSSVPSPRGGRPRR